MTTLINDPEPTPTAEDMRRLIRETDACEQCNECPKCDTLQDAYRRYREVNP